MVAQCGADGRQAAGSHIREVVECPVIEAVVVDRSPVAPFATLEPSEPVARMVAEVDFVQPRVMADKGQPGLAVIQRSEEHTSELQSLMRNSYAVFCLKKKNYNISALS